MEGEQIQESLNEIRKDMREIRLCVVGDKLRNVPGLIDIIETHRRELYGDKQTMDQGLKDISYKNRDRIEVLEKERLKLFAMAGGISLTVGIFYSLVKLFLFH